MQLVLSNQLHHVYVRLMRDRLLAALDAMNLIYAPASP
jgi:hypothetical protein